MGAAREALQFISQEESPSSISTQSNHCVISVDPGQETGKLETCAPVLDSSSICVTLERSLHLPELYFPISLLHCYSFLATQQVPATVLNAFHAGSHLLLQQPCVVGCILAIDR